MLYSAPTPAVEHMDLKRPGDQTQGCCFTQETTQLWRALNTKPENGLRATPSAVQGCATLVSPGQWLETQNLRIQSRHVQWVLRTSMTLMLAEVWDALGWVTSFVALVPKKVKAKYQPPQTKRTKQMLLLSIYAFKLSYHSLLDSAGPGDAEQSPVGWFLPCSCHLSHTSCTCPPCSYPVMVAQHCDCM